MTSAHRFSSLLLSVSSVFGAFFSGDRALAADQPQWGEEHSRNMVSAEVGLPDGFDPESGRNVNWVVPLGTRCYSTPVIASGRVFVGTNNAVPRDPKHQGDRGVLMCFDEQDGSLQWQLVVPKLENDVYLDWPLVGMCSSPTVEGDRVYTVTNRDEVVCLDINGLADGNDGPYQDEAQHMIPIGEAPMQLGELDADILWMLDLRQAVGVRPHDSVHCSILIDGAYLYINTNNGLNSTHSGVEKPEAPSLVVVDKRTGRLVAQDREPIGPKIFHSTWSSPALGTVDGQKRVFFAGGDGVIYGFEPLPAENPGDSLSLQWRFDCDPTAPKEDVHSYIRNRKVSPSTVSSLPVVHKQKLYVTAGGDIWWGKREANLLCIDLKGSGDVTEQALKWSYGMQPHCCSTPAIAEGLVYVADCGGKVHCLDAETGVIYWVHDAGREIWGSTLVADNKVYVGTRRGDFWVLAAGKEKKVIDSVRLDSEIIATPVAANGKLYVATMTRLYSLKLSP